MSPLWADVNTTILMKWVDVFLSLKIEDGQHYHLAGSQLLCWESNWSAARKAGRREQSICQSGATIFVTKAHGSRKEAGSKETDQEFTFPLI